MRSVIQRVNFAELRVNDTLVSKIGNGLVVLLGVEQADGKDDIDWLCKKLTQLRIFSDADGKMNESLLDQNAEILIISQFTLYARVKKGNRPSFIGSAEPKYAELMYKQVISHLQTILPNEQVKSGVFGGNMQVLLENNGPVTISIDSKNRV